MKIEQQSICSASIAELCTRFSPASRLEELADITGYFAHCRWVRTARKIAHLRPDRPIAHALEVVEAWPDENRHVIVTLKEDFSGPQAWACYRDVMASSDWEER